MGMRCSGMPNIAGKSLEIHSIRMETGKMEIIVRNMGWKLYTFGAEWNENASYDLSWFEDGTWTDYRTVM